MARTGYEGWADITGQADKVFVLSNQYTNAYKNTVSDPANSLIDVEKAFAPDHLFHVDKDMYYSDYEQVNPAYVYEFLDFDDRAPLRGFYKRTELGKMFPTIVKDSEVPSPGQPITWKRREPVSVWQDESAPLSDIHFRNVVDFHMFDFAKHFLVAGDYQRFKDGIFDAMRRGNARIEKLWIDTFIAAVLGIYSYPMGDALFRFFVDNDDKTPDEQHSKVARQFYLKDGEIREKLKELKQHVQKYYLNRTPYLTNVNKHEIIGQSLDETIPKWSEALADRSDATKALKYVRQCFLTEDAQKKCTKIGYGLRRMCIDSLSSMIFHILDRMMTENAFNWCGHEYGKSPEAKEAYELRCRPENLVVLLNNGDLTDMYRVIGSQIEGQIAETRSIRDTLQSYAARGVSFYGVNFILPSMCMIVDKAAFRLIEYFNESYSRFHEYDLIDATVHHMFKKPVLYRKVACTVLELAKGQKFALPIGWASEHLPYIRDNT